jgi:hypothetical protein
MKMFSQVPFCDLKIGDRVIGANGVHGSITRLIPVSEARREEDNDIGITWDNGNKSLVWHFWTNKVQYLGSP